MTREEAINILKAKIELNLGGFYSDQNAKSDEAYRMAIEALEQTRWIPVKYHAITDEERKEEGYPDDWLFYFDCQMPEEGQEILITTKNGYVEKDICGYDDSIFLDSGYDWIDDVVAWMPLPEPYKTDEEKE